MDFLVGAGTWVRVRWQSRDGRWPKSVEWLSPCSAPTRTGLMVAQVAARMTPQAEVLVLTAVKKWMNQEAVRAAHRLRWWMRRLFTGQ